MGRGGVEKRRAAYVAMGSWGDVAIKKKVGGGPCQHNSYLLLHVPHTHVYCSVHISTEKFYLFTKQHMWDKERFIFVFLIKGIQK